MTKLAETAISDHFLSCLHHAGRQNDPYPHWLLRHCLPEEVVDELLALPITPPHIEDTKGRRETHNDSRVHFGARYQREYQVIESLAKVFQSQRIVEGLRALTEAPLTG
ncbi:MAG: hypothetical protein ACM3KD_02310, partial [Hyphomicrobiaceae bacterium]